MTEKRIIFTGGGTAGHVIVNLALIPIFKEEGWQIDYIGSSDGIERRLVNEMEGVTYHAVSTGKLRRYLSIENLKDPFKVLKGIYDAWKIIGEIRPQVIFSKGGFVSVPVVLAAKLRGVPTIIHESDITPGLANKVAAPFVKEILTTFPETLEFVPAHKSTYVGAVIREELFEGSKAKGYAFTSLSEDKPVILVMGGSGGSQKINAIVRSTLPMILKTHQVIHICGAGNLDPTVEAEGYVQYEYVNEELKDIFAITDFVVSRAGANAIFEFLALEIPMLLIPLSLAASRGDQIDNAKSFSDRGYAMVLEEEQLSVETFVEAIKDLNESAPELIEHMQTYQSDTSRDHVVHVIKNVVKK